MSDKDSQAVILAVDIGTTAMKMGVFRLGDTSLELLRQFSGEYAINIYNDGLFGDIEQDKWRQAFVAGCRSLADAVEDVDIIALSGTTPGLAAMDAAGEALYPAILMLDQRSRKQAQHIIDTVGMDTLLGATGNMPVAGGCSLASILWIKDNHPDIFNKTHTFGHSNTYVAHWLTGEFAIDPSSASLTALYNTVDNDLTWNTDIAEAFGIAQDTLPRIVLAWQSVGQIRPELARDLGLRREPAVLVGGNDAVLAAYSLGITEPGQIVNVNGTCEITLVCLDRCLPSANYNVRAHVLPGRWLTLHVLNAGGRALQWYKDVFCAELGPEQFYDRFVPEAVDAWLGRDSTVTYVPYLMGSRYSLKPLKGELLGLTSQTTRQEILAAIVKGLCEYQKKHLDEIGQQVTLEETIHVTGGAVNPALIRAKSRWYRDCMYLCEEQSSMKGAAMLARLHLDNQ